MSDDRTAPASGPDRDEPRPGWLAWAVIASGWVVMGIAVVGAVGDVRIGDLGSWATWVLGAALVHDALLLPVVTALGWLLTRWVPVPYRVPLRTALVVSGIVALTVWPIARRWGARADNPSLLPLPVQRNLAIIVAVLIAVAIAVGAVSAWRARTAASSPPE